MTHKLRRAGLIQWEYTSGMPGHSVELALESGPISNADLKLLGQSLDDGFEFPAFFTCGVVTAFSVESAFGHRVESLVPFMFLRCDDFVLPRYCPVHPVAEVAECAAHKSGAPDPRFVGQSDDAALATVDRLRGRITGEQAAHRDENGLARGVTFGFDLVISGRPVPFRDGDFSAGCHARYPVLHEAAIPSTVLLSDINFRLSRAGRARLSLLSGHDVQ